MFNMKKQRIVLAALLIFSLSGCTPGDQGSKAAESTLAESFVTAVSDAGNSAGATNSAASTSSSSATNSTLSTAQTVSTIVSSTKSDEDLLKETQSLTSDLKGTLNGLDDITDEGTKVPD